MKKKTKIISSIVLVILILGVVVFFLFQHSRVLSDLPKAETDLGEIAEVGAIEKDISQDQLNDDTKMIPLYMGKKIDTNQLIDQLSRYFSYQVEKGTFYNDKKEKVSLNKQSKLWSYSNYDLLNKAYAYKVPDNKTCETIVVEFIQAMNIYKGFDYKMSVTSNSEYSREMDKVLPYEKMVDVTFIIEKYPIWNSSLSVTIGDNGNILEIKSDVEPVEKTTNKVIISNKEALQKITPDYKYIGTNYNLNKVILKSVTLIYWRSSSNQHLTPVWAFSGKGKRANDDTDFSVIAYVPAVE